VKKSQRNSRTQITDHHILPKARGGGDQEENIAKVARYKHEIYHVLFSNKTPVEIICFLVEYFWRGQWEYVEQALERRRK